VSTIERTGTIPPLVAGQRLRRDEFHRRYEAMPPGTRAELIGGVVYMPSPLRDRHGTLTVLAGAWLSLYRFRTPGLSVSADATVELDELGEPQPDVSMRILPEYGGQSHNAGEYIGGAPELIVEVAGSSRGVDLGPKLADYERAGVVEYLVVALDPDEVYWHARRGDRLERVAPGADGLYRSARFPGLWLDPSALLADDGPALVAVLERGLATAEHAAFVAQLAENRRRR
jgi:Uma2 family endonuclease